MMDFQQWLESHSIDCQTLEADMHASLRERYEAEQERLKPVPLLVLPVDCAWPQRGHWTPAVVSQ